MSDLVLVYSGTVTQADVVKGLLADAGIKAFLDSEQMASTLPIAVDFAGDEAGRVMVAQEDESKAREIIAQAKGGGQAE